jgi:hypothetical protein
MSNLDSRYPTSKSGGASPHVPVEHYGPTPATPSKTNEQLEKTRCATGIVFIQTIHGILNLIIIVSNHVYRSNSNCNKQIHC